MSDLNDQIKNAQRLVIFFKHSKRCNPGIHYTWSVCTNRVALPTFAKFRDIVTDGFQNENSLNWYTLNRYCSRTPCTLEAELIAGSLHVAIGGIRKGTMFMHFYTITPKGALPLNLKYPGCSVWKTREGSYLLDTASSLAIFSAPYPAITGW